MRDNPLVSIVITCFNEEQFLADAIASVHRQTYAPLELIIVDDGSTDGTLAVARREAPEAMLLTKPNGGLSSARNAGLDLVSGDYVVFLDGDDLLDPEFVSKTFHALDQAGDVSFVYTQMRLFGREHSISEWPPFSIGELTRGNYISATSLIRVSACAEARFDESLRTGWEDWDFFLTLAERGHRGALLDEPLLLYRKHDDRSRMSDLMVEARNKRRARLRIMRRHIGLFGARRYAHYLAHHVKESLRSESAPANGSRSIPAR